LFSNYSYIGLYIVIAVLFSLVLIILPVILRFIKIIPHHPNPVKNATFECGMETIGKAWVRFNFRYYFYALMFVALDIMVIFMYPWAVDLRQGGLYALAAMLVFVFIIVIGYLYAWKKKVLEWK
jgi:NADH-quinone oxidoreductase subunit A